MTKQTQPNAIGGYDRIVDPSADYNWDFNPIDNATITLDIRFETQDGDVADKFVSNNQQG
jgi:2',3'-cyclic-nucleotide 2'-phosphodiesterase/3'-nucleotidase